MIFCERSDYYFQRSIFFFFLKNFLKKNYFENIPFQFEQFKSIGESKEMKVNKKKI